MRAVQAREFGGPEVLVLGDLPQPEPAPEEVRIEVAAADVMFLDTRLRSGWGTDYFPVRPPYVPGGAIAGIVREAGAAVDPSWVGRRVMSVTTASGIGGGVPVGGYAEQALAKANTLIEVPERVSFEQAAALVHDGRMAVALFERAEVHPGDHVLITAAAGGLGTLLIQFAHQAGATVVAAARGRAKLDLTTRLGADVAVDYSETGWADRVLAATGGAGPRIVWDGAGGALGETALGLVADAGRFLGYGAAAGEFVTTTGVERAKARGVDVVGLHDLDADFDAAARRALAQVAAGNIEVVVGQSFPLEQAHEAHSAIEARAALGRTLLVR